MKRLILLIFVITTFLSGSAQTGTDSGGEAVYHKYLAVAQIQVGVEYQETFGSFGVALSQAPFPIREDFMLEQMPISPSLPA